MRKNYISDHNILYLDVSMNVALLVHVPNTMEELTQYLNDFLFLKDLEFIF